MDTRFLPTTAEEVRARGWDALDVILVSGDSYIDSPFIGAAVIGRVLEAAGFRVGIIAQPDITSPADITASANRASSGASTPAASIQWSPTPPPANSLAKG